MNDARLRKAASETKGESERIIDAETLRLLKDRDTALLETIFRETSPYLTRICLANGIYQDDVGELIHQTWERFFSNLEKFEGRSQIRTFICGILFNKIREHRRLQKRFVPEEDAHKFMDDAFTPDGWWKVAPADPHKMAENGQLANLIKECLEGLTEQQAAAFVMKEVEEENSESICNVLGVNVSYLRVLLFRAKDKLRKCLEGKVDAERA